MIPWPIGPDDEYAFPLDWIDPETESEDAP